jgi:hypothetical protein
MSGSGGVAPLFSFSALDGVSDLLHASAVCIPGKEPRYPMEAGLAPGLVWTLWNREESIVLVGTRTPAVQPVASHYTDSPITEFL